MSSAYQKLKRLDKAISFIQRALEIKEKEGDDPYGLTFVYSNIADIHIQKNELGSALDYLQKAEGLLLKNKFEKGL